MSCEGASDVADHPGGEAGRVPLPSSSTLTEEPQQVSPSHHQEQSIEATPLQ